MSRNRNEDRRQDPFRSLGNEPVEDMITGNVPLVLQQRSDDAGRGNGRGRGRKAIRPAELRRRERKLTITFSSPTTVSRLRALAEYWDVRSNNGSPHISSVVEHLLLPQIEAAERGEIDPPAGARRQEGRSLEVLEEKGGKQWL
jgi:hypothetical protein